MEQLAATFMDCPGVRAVCGQEAEGTSESQLWLTQEMSDIFASVQTRREEWPALVTRQLMLALGPFLLHAPTFPSFLGPENISHHVLLPLTFSLLLRRVVSPRLCSLRGREPQSPEHMEGHPATLEHAHTHTLIFSLTHGT